MLVEGLESPLDLVARIDGTRAMTEAGGVWCWGANDAGLLGFEQPAGLPSKGVQEFQEGVVSVLDVAMGHEFSCVVTTHEDSTVVGCWGAGADGKRGAGESPNSAGMQFIGGTRGATEVIAGRDFAYVLFGTDPELVCWGNNRNSPLGEEFRGYVVPPRPTLLPNFSRVDEVVGGDTMLCARGLDLEGAGRAACVGLIDPYFAYPGGRTMSPPGEVVGLGAGDGHAAFLNDAGEFWVVGRNVNGQANPRHREAIGEGERVNLPAAAETLFVGFETTCAVVDGVPYCWGDNSAGQLGNDAIEVTEPVRIDLENVVQIAPGRYQVCALTTDSEVYCWGQDASARLGGVPPGASSRRVRSIERPDLAALCLEHLRKVFMPSGTRRPARPPPEGGAAKGRLAPSSLRRPMRLRRSA